MSVALFEVLISQNFALFSLYIKTFSINFESQESVIGRLSKEVLEYFHRLFRLLLCICTLLLFVREVFVGKYYLRAEESCLCFVELECSWWLLWNVAQSQVDELQRFWVHTCFGIDLNNVKDSFDVDLRFGGVVFNFLEKHFPHSSSFVVVVFKHISLHKTLLRC